MSTLSAQVGTNSWAQKARWLPIVQFDEFLVREELNGLINYCLRNEIKFRGSEVTGHTGQSKQDRGYRRSSVLFELGVYHSLFRDRLSTFFPHVLAALRKTPFRVVDLEIQLTASNHGEFFRAHTDNDNVNLRGREVTFVYYFHREPRRFSGGELRIFDAKGTEQPNRSTNARLIYPLQNQIIFFPSHYLHEVLPVFCPSRRFADSRFTVNGWYHR